MLDIVASTMSRMLFNTAGQSAVVSEGQVRCFFASRQLAQSISDIWQMPDRELTAIYLVTNCRMIYVRECFYPNSISTPPCDLWSRVKCMWIIGPIVCIFFSIIVSLLLACFDSAVRHRRILRLPPLLLLSIMMAEHHDWIEYFKETRRACFQVVYAFRNDAFRENAVLSPTSG